MSVLEVSQVDNSYERNPCESVASMISERRPIKKKKVGHYYQKRP